MTLKLKILYCCTVCKLKNILYYYKEMELEVVYFLQRLHQLQSLCSSRNSDLPNALLFIPGADGRNNKGSSKVLKYLFFGSVGKDLDDGFLEGKYDSLEEMVLLIQDTSVSVFYRYVSLDF